MARYPTIQVTVQSDNPLALVAAVREELRLARIEPELISRFTDEAMASPNQHRIQSICGQWVDIGTFEN